MSALRPVAVVTGGSRGIGAAVCRELAAQGWSVAVGGSSHMEEAEAVAAGIRRRGGNAAAYRADVRDRAVLDAMLGDASLRLGPIGALVCCAGVAQQKLFQDITDEDWDRMFDINIKGVYRSIQAALPYLMKRERSRIVTFSSMWGQVGASCESHYAASKGAVIALTQSLAKELGPSGRAGQLRLPRHDPDRHDGGVGAGDAGCAGGGNPAGAQWKPGGCGKGRGVPLLGGGGFHHRAGGCRQRGIYRLARGI